MILLFVFLCLCMTLMLSVGTLGYIDPSTGTFIIQAIAGIVIAGSAFFFVWWRKLRKKVSKKLGIDENAGKEVEEDVVISESAESDSEEKKE